MGWLFGQNKRKKIFPNATAAGANGFGKPFHIQFSYHELPDAGAQQYSYDTLCLPKYSPIGNGPGNRRSFQYTTPSLQPLRGTTLQAIGQPGVLTGQFVSGPLTDISGGSMPADLMAAFAGSRLPANSYVIPV
jgi:hypothetical protein